MLIMRSGTPSHASTLRQCRRASVARLSTGQCEQVHLLKVLDPVEAFPDYSAQAAVQTQANEQFLRTRTNDFAVFQIGLLATDDELLDQWA